LALHWCITQRQEAAGRLARFTEAVRYLQRVVYRPQVYEEIRRLQQEGHLNLKLLDTDYAPEAYMLIGRAIELAKLFQAHGYRVFTHGQALYISAIVDMINAMRTVYHPNRVHELMTLLRAINLSAYVSVPEMLKRFENPEYDDHVGSADLVCLTPWLLDCWPFESANYFMSENKNMLTDIEVLSPHCPHGVQCAGQCSKLYSHLSFLARKIAAGKQTSCTVGALNLIAVPEGDVKDLMWGCHEMGYPCCEAATSTPTKDEVCTAEPRKCSHNRELQYRAVAQRLSLSRRVRVIHLTALGRHKDEEFRQQMLAIAHAHKAYTDLHPQLNKQERVLLSTDLAHNVTVAGIAKVRAKWEAVISASARPAAA
jgi:hypothetical protein